MTGDQSKGGRVLWMPLEAPWGPRSPGLPVCCEAMARALDFSCPDHADPFECADALVVYNDVFDEYGLIIHDGGASYVLVSHCPWCAAKLPESQRDRWFDVTDQLPEGQPLPGELLSGAWRRDRG